MQQNMQQQNYKMMQSPALSVTSTNSSVQYNSNQNNNNSNNQNNQFQMIQQNNFQQYSHLSNKLDRINRGLDVLLQRTNQSSTGLSPPQLPKMATPPLSAFMSPGMYPQGSHLQQQQQQQQMNFSHAPSPMNLNSLMNKKQLHHKVMNYFIMLHHLEILKQFHIILIYHLQEN
ncbi:unnamed protein product [[Candida] boidinii]|nr:unnamed protein product [[Candida] boidinii]